MNLNIRLMRMSDLPQIMSIEKDIYTDPWLEEMFYQEIDLESSYVLEDVKSFSILGYMCGIRIIDEYSLMNIGVAKKQQKKGYGTTLLYFLIVKCINERCRSIFLEVRESNIEAINLYQKNGFKLFGKRKGYYSHPVEDALLMKLDLQTD